MASYSTMNTIPAADVSETPLLQLQMTCRDNADWDTLSDDC